MVERRRLTRRRSGRGGARRGAGRPPGGTTEYKRVARARAQRAGMLPDELLLEWARTGLMGRERLTPDQRISCAKGCAAWYKPPMAAVKRPGDPDPAIVLTLDEKTLARLSTDRQEALRDVLRMIAAGGDLATVAPAAPVGDAEAYRRSLN